MPIIFACPHCGKKFSAKEEHAGVQGKCPVCGKMTRIPSQPTAEATGSPDSPPPPPADGEKRRPLWKNPFVVIGMAASNFILAACLTSLAWLHFRASRNGADAQGVVNADRSINPVRPKQQLPINQQGPPPARDQNPPGVPPVNAGAAAAKSRIGPASTINKPPARIPPITPPPIQDSLVRRWAAETIKLMQDYEPEMIPADSLDPRSGAMQWPIRVQMQGRVPNFPLGTEAIVNVGDEQFNKVQRLNESGIVGNASIVVMIIEDRYNIRHSMAQAGVAADTTPYQEAIRLYQRSLKVGDSVGINMVIASGFAVRVKTGTRVRVVEFGNGRGQSPSGLLPSDSRQSRDVKILDGDGRGAIVSIPALYLEPAP